MPNTKPLTLTLDIDKETKTKVRFGSSSTDIKIYLDKETQLKPWGNPEQITVTIKPA